MTSAPATGGAGVGGARTASAAGLRLIGHHDLAGHGDGMQVIRHGDAVYVGHTGTTGAGTSVLDAADPSRPVLVTQWPAPPRSHTHKVQVADGLLLVNHEKFPYRAPDSGPVSAGLAVYASTTRCGPARSGSGAAAAGECTGSSGPAAGTRTCRPFPSASPTASGWWSTWPTPRARPRRPAGGGPASGRTSSRAGPRASATRRITP